MLVSRIPVPYTFWKSIGMFRLGCMDFADYPLKIFKLHAERAYPQGLPPDSVILELGPGDSIASAIIGCAYGVKRTYLIDVGNFASENLSFYRYIATDIAKKGMNAPDLSQATSFDDIVRICNAEYLTDGVSSLKQIPSKSIDFVWSHSGGSCGKGQGGHRQTHQRHQRHTATVCTGRSACDCLCFWQRPDKYLRTGSPHGRGRLAHGGPAIAAQPTHDSIARASVGCGQIPG